MVDAIQGLRKDLNRFQDFLSRGVLLSYSEEERESLLENCHRLVQRFEAAEENTLAIGLLGGTGVGKSSLMNALAGSPIASTSHRRPHTDRVLIYRHGDAPLPPLMESCFYRGVQVHPLQDIGPDRAKALDDPLWIEITHRADSIRTLLLCDLPDFDSLVGEHRRRVLVFLEHLDVIVWVASPEKYADARFYAFLRQAPKARENFYFLLNKADLLFQGRSVEAGYGELGKVMARFTEHLIESEVGEPILYAVSAADAMGAGPPAPWNQFTHFRHQIFQLRDAKEVAAIKAANLDVEVRRFLLVVEKEMFQLQTLMGVLQELASELEEERQDWVRAGDEALSLWLERRMRGEVAELLDDPAQLVGPGHLVALAAQSFRALSRSASAKESPDPAPFHSGTGFLLETQLERLENRIMHRILHRGLPAKLAGRVEDVFNAKREWESYQGRVREFMANRIGEFRPRSARGRRVFQRAVYAALFLLFLIALGGEAPWRDLLRSPGLGTLLALVSEITFTLFSPKGFAALGSWLLLQVLLGFRFYGRYKKSLQRRTQKFIESLKLGLGKLWEEELHTVIRNLTETGVVLGKQAAELSSLYTGSRRE